MLMGFQSQRDHRTIGTTSAEPGHTLCGNLLVVEPDALLRWSLVTYFSRWFNVFAVATTEAGTDIIHDETINAAVVSDTLDVEQLRRMEQRACERNPGVLIIRVVTSASSAGLDPYASGMLEKPFELAALADMLHVPHA